MRDSLSPSQRETAMERIAGTEDPMLSWAGNLEVHLLADTGVIGLGLFVLSFVLATVEGVRSYRRSTEPSARIFSIASVLKARMVQSPLQPQILKRKFRRISLPCGVCDTSG